ncbi:MAG: sulfatase [Acidobacteria bacterium]|nr:sulfatase [Acidobacteriota bacterium]
MTPNDPGNCVAALGRRDLLKLPLATFARAARPERPDVLFIAIEDIQTCLSSYGNRVSKTPNIDALAARGMRFDYAGCAYPLCNPTRSSLLTGLRPPTTGIRGNEQDWNEKLAPGTTLPECFRAGGYETIRVGKIFHAGNKGRVFDDRARWNRVVDEREGLAKPNLKGNWQPRFLYDQLSAKERAKVYDQRAWEWGPQGEDDLDGADGGTAEQAVRILSAKHEKPLFLALGFHRPHLPLRAPRKYFDMYPPQNIPLPDYPADDLSDVPHRYSLANHKTFTDEKRREAIAAYYACVAYVDACVGRVMRALRDTGRDKNTVVVLWGDHGFHLGEHLLWQKMTLFEESCRVPFMIVAPGVTKPGSVCRRPVECVDLFPTLAELCSVKTPGNLESISMVPLLKDPSRLWKKGAFTYINNGVTVRTEKWRYTEWGSPANAELYDKEKDPREIVNVAKNPRYAAAVKQMSALLRGGWRAALR